MGPQRLCGGQVGRDDLRRLPGHGGQQVSCVAGVGYVYFGGHGHSGVPTRPGNASIRESPVICWRGGGLARCCLAPRARANDVTEPADLYPPGGLPVLLLRPKLLAAPQPGSDKLRQVVRACSGQHFGTQANVWRGNAVIDWLDRLARRIRRLGRIWAHSERVIITQPGGCRDVEVAAN